MKKKHVWTYTVTSRNGHPDDPPPLPAPVVTPAPASGDSAQEALARAQFELDAARAEAARLRREADTLRTQMPSDAQLARLADLERQAQEAEEARRRKEADFDAWRVQIEQNHQRQLEAVRQETETERQRADQRERELNDTHIELAFKGATEWFGATGKTVMLPDMARSYFSPYVEVHVEDVGGKPRRTVVVKDYNGAVIVDTKSGRPAPFDVAIGQLIELHPHKASLMRGSGKVGSGSSGGAGGVDDINLGRLRPGDFNNPDVRDRVRQQLRAPGGISVGPAFDRMEEATRRNR